MLTKINRSVTTKITTFKMKCATNMACEACQFLRGSGGMPPQGKIFKFTFSEKEPPPKILGMGLLGGLCMNV